VPAADPQSDRPLARRRRGEEPIIIASLVELARGHGPGPYGWHATVGAIAYLAAIVVFRIRG